MVTTALLLAIHPEAQQRVYEEVHRVIGDDPKRAITRADIDQLHFTDQCMRETMRLYPMVPIIARQNNRPIKLGGITIPPRTPLVVVITSLHRNKRAWGADADVFRPERFAADEFGNIHPFAFLGFSGGPRNCVGYKYAEVVVKMALARMVQNYRFTTPLRMNDIRISVDINTRFITKHPVEMFERWRGRRKERNFWMFSN